MAGDAADRLVKGGVTGLAVGEVGRVSGPFCPHPLTTPAARVARAIRSRPRGPDNRAVGRVCAPSRRSGRDRNTTLEDIARAIERFYRVTPSGLTDAEYHRLSTGVLSAIEQTIDRWLQEDVIDIDAHRTGGLLELVFPDRSRIVVNTQPPLHELWLASRAGGYHYRHAQGRWIDTRDGSDFYEVLSREATAQAGRLLRFEG